MRNEKEKKNIIDNLNIQIPSYALLTIGVPKEEVFNEIMKDYEKSDKKTKTKIDKYKEALEKINAIRNISEKGVITKEYIERFISSKDIKKHLDIILRNQINDLHFLPACPPLFQNPSVLFLRYLSTCSIDIINMASNCINQEDWDTKCKSLSIKYFEKKPERLLRLKSPYLENLMNRIGLLYLRIGTPDLTVSEYKKAIEGAFT